MSHSQPILTNFSLGEVSPLIDGRFDLQEYVTGLRQCENFRTTPQGGIQVREGTLYVGKSHAVGSAKCRLVEFIFSRTEAYVLEFTTFKIRVGRFNPTTGEPEIIALTSPVTTPYTDSEIDSINYTQFRDTIYLFHTNRPPMVLKKVAYNNWTIRSFGDTDGVLNPTPVQTPSETTNGQDATKAPYITFLDQRFGTLFGVADKDRFGIQITILTDNSDATYKNIPNASVPSYDPTAQVVVQSLTGIFKPTDVGEIFKDNDVTGTLGFWKIVGYINAYYVRATMLTEALYYSTSTQMTRLARWVAWGTRGGGYPTTGCVHEQRLVVASTPFYPQVIWGSVSGDYENFNPGAQNDSDSYVFGLSSSDSSPIRWMESCRILLIGTEGGEYRISGTASFFATPITPTSVDIKPQTSIGGGYVKAKRVGQSVFFIDRSKRKLLRLDYISTFDNYLAADMVHIAEHISLGGIKQLCWQGFPNYTLWAVRDDGQLCGLTYVPELKMQAWQRIKTDGYVESAACIPDSDGEKDRLWISCRRINDVDGLVALYKMDGVTGDTYVKEEISNTPPKDPKNYEDLSGKFYRQLDIRSSWRKGVYGNAAFLNGDQEFISLNPNAMPRGDFSLALWLIPETAISPSFVNDMNVIRYGDDNSTNDVALVFKGTNSEDALGNVGTLVFKINKTIAIESDGSSWNSGQPYFIVATYSNVDGLRMYVNGDVQSDVDTASHSRGTVISKHFQIGKRFTIASPYPSASGLMNGGIDHFRIYNRVLSLNDVKILYGYGA